MYDRYYFTIGDLFISLTYDDEAAYEDDVEEGTFSWMVSSTGDQHKAHALCQAAWDELRKTYMYEPCAIPVTGEEAYGRAYANALITVLEGTSTPFTLEAQ